LLLCLLLLCLRCVVHRRANRIEVQTEASPLKTTAQTQV
jgi:hypothetical protein